MFSKTVPAASTSPEKYPSWVMPNCHFTRVDKDGFQVLTQIACDRQLSFVDHDAAVANRIESTDELSRLRSVEALHAAKNSEHAKMLESLAVVEAKIEKEKSDLASDDSMQRLRNLVKEQDIVLASIEAANKELSLLKSAIEPKREAVRQVCATATQAYREDLQSQTSAARDVAERNLFDKAGPELIAIAQALMDVMHVHSVSTPSVLSRLGIS